jgi:putative CocE/NonD family hydrolase
MRDGIALNASVYLPRDPAGPVPAIVEMTPYHVDGGHGEGLYFARNGYAWVCIDCRGRGDSEGQFAVWKHDAEDLHDAIAWISRQDWCSGGVGLYGSSYSGTNQWMVLKDPPAALKTMIPAGAAMPGYDMPRGGVPFAHTVTWGILTAGRSLAWKAMAEGGIWAQELFELHRRQGSALSLLPRLNIQRSEGQQEQFDYLTWGPHWESLLPSAKQLARVDIPILSITGHFDSTQMGTLAHWKRLERLAPVVANKHHQLLIGPWGHGGMEGSDHLGEIQFGPAAKADIKALKLAWYDWALKGAARPAALEDRVSYYVAGKEEWRSAPSLEALTSRPLMWALHAAAEPGDAYASGRLGDSAAPPAAESFVIDLDDPEAMGVELQHRGADAGLGDTYGVAFPEPLHNLFGVMYGDDPTDQVYALDLRGQGLVYHSRPLTEDLELSGVPRLTLRLALDVPDADLGALLYEVRTDGQAILLSTDMLRLRFRGGGLDSGQSLLAVPGEPFDAAFERWRFMARHVPKGSRIRLLVRSLNGLAFERNPLTRQPDGVRRGTVQVFTGTQGANPGSRLELPLGAARPRAAWLNEEAT